jgi:Protein of unknown function (DUF1501)
MTSPLSRRSFLQFGLGSALFLGLGLPLAQRRAQAQAPLGKGGKAKACILLYMEGGPSQIDTFDPKPGQATGGDFAAIESALSGVRLSEHLPKMAAQLPRTTLIRSLTSKEGNHQRARHLMHTGYAPGGGVNHPAFGSLLAQEQAPDTLPGYVSINGLSASLSPFPVVDPTKPVRYLAPVDAIDAARVDTRLSLRNSLDARFEASHPSPYAEGQRKVNEQAVALMRSPEVAAFQLDKESERTRAAYGEHKFGQGCLMARRLVEAGVPFVEVTLPGWDTHKENFSKVKELSAQLDQGMSALLSDLAASGRLAETLVVWMGDFGRTPRLNENGGRDHFPKCSSVLLAGGGVKEGQVIGATNATGEEIAERPVEVPDLFRSLAYALGLDPDHERMSPNGRPLRNVNGGSLITELF